jgi:predicted dehydrogenase
MAEKSAIGIAVVGCGYWGINYVRVFSELPNSKVVAVCDVSEDRLNVVKQRFPQIEAVNSVDKLLNMSGVDAVVIATQAANHYGAASPCIAAKRHVLIEKPITTTSEDAQKLMDEAAAAHVTLMVGHTFIYNSGVQKVRSYIDQGNLGHIYYMYARRTNLGPIRQDVNALWDLATHDVSIFNYLLNNPPKWVSAVGSNILHRQQEDVGFVALSYGNNILGHIHASWADPNKVREVVVVGSDRRVVFDDTNPLERVRIFEKGVTTVSEKSADSYGEYSLLMRDGDIISPKVEVSEPLKSQCRHFLECLMNNRRPMTGGQEGFDVVKVMEAINRSMKNNGVPVELA